MFFFHILLSLSVLACKCSRFTRRLLWKTCLKHLVLCFLIWKKVTFVVSCLIGVLDFKITFVKESCRYLLEHPEYARQGVTLSKFSFQSPRSLQENYVRKRPPRVTNPCDGDMILPRTLEPEEGV